MKDLVNAESPWRDRLRALKNMPAVLRILWESGRAVVSWGLILRVIVATLPFGIAKVAQYIITDIAGVLRGNPLRSELLAPRHRGGCPQRLSGPHHASHRLLGLAPRQPLHPARQRSRHGAGCAPRPYNLRRSRLLRSTRDEPAFRQPTDSR